VAFAQVVDNELGAELEQIFPELSEGYIDLNNNGEKDQSVEINETVPDSQVKDSIVQVQEVLDFLLEQYRFIPLEKLESVKQSLAEAEGTIPEIINLSYREQIGQIVKHKRELGEEGIYLTPSARRNALEKMRSLITSMVHAYKKEGKSYEDDFIEARDELFSMIEKGYPFPESLNQEDSRVLKNSMINTIVNQQSGDSAQVKTAIKTLGKLQAETAVPYLVELIEQKEYRIPTIETLGEIGNQKALDLLTQQLARTQNAQEKRAIVRSIGKIGGEAGMERIVALFPKEAGEVIEKDLERPALEALVSLARKGNTSSRIFSIFEEYLEEDDPELKVLAIRGLSYFGGRAGDLLIDVLKEGENEEVLRWAVRGLNRTGHSATISTFINMLRDEDVSPAIKTEIVKALGENPQGPKAAQYIIQHLGSPNRQLREAVSETLVSLYQEDPRTITGYLSRGLRGSEDEVYLTEGSAVLARIADPDSINTLYQLLQKAYPEMKKNVTWALYRIGSQENTRVVEELTKLVTSETESLPVRINAVRAIGAIGYDSANIKAWETLVTTAKMRGDKYAMLKYYAVRSLGALGEKNEKIVSTLTGIAVRDQDPELKKEAVDAIRELAAADEEVAEQMVTLFKRTDDTELKVRIIELLGDMRFEAIHEVAADVLFTSLSQPKKRRIIYGLAKAGTSESYSLIIDAAENVELQEFIQGVLTGADPRVMKPLITRRLETESNEDIVALLERLQAVYAARF
jgi:HEAT repeat protein